MKIHGENSALQSYNTIYYNLFTKADDFWNKIHAIITRLFVIPRLRFLAVPTAFAMT